MPNDSLAVEYTKPFADRVAVALEAYVTGNELSELNNAGPIDCIARFVADCMHLCNHDTVEFMDAMQKALDEYNNDVINARREADQVMSQMTRDFRFTDGEEDEEGDDGYDEDGEDEEE